MKRSVNEIQGMVLKAARGAGVPLGVCEDLRNSVPFFISNKALGDVVHLIEAGCGAAQSAIDGCLSGEDVAVPKGVAASAMICLGAAQGLCLVEAAGVMRATQDDPIAPFVGAHDVPDAIWARFETWAARTYVPASEASRIAGAGAGLTDND